MSNLNWPPQPPESPKPNFSDRGAAEWRYERYKYDRYQAGKPQEDILSTVTFVDKMDIARRITYRPGDDVETKTLNN